MTPRQVLRNAWLGAVAGAAGTLAMDSVLFVRYRRSGGKQGFVAWETAEGVDTWDKTSDPGRVGQLILKRVTGNEPPDSWARSTSNVIHWMTGVGWGAQFGLLDGATKRNHRQLTQLFGPAVWLSSYVILPLLKVYKPIWAYDAKTLAKDLSAHQAYGNVTAAVFAALARRR